MGLRQVRVPRREGCVLSSPLVNCIGYYVADDYCHSMGRDFAAERRRTARHKFWPGSADSTHCYPGPGRTSSLPLSASETFGVTCLD